MTTTDIYVEALLEIANNDSPTESLFSGLKATLKRRGHEKLYPSILKNFKLRLQNKIEKRTAVLAVANPEAEKKLATSIESASQSLSVNDKYDVKVDDTLIGGFVLTNGDLRIDSSYKSVLVDLYRNITK